MDIEKWVDKTFRLSPAKGSNVRHVDFDWNKIDTNIYLGTNSCCQYHFDTELLSQGVSVDISLESERLDMAAGVETFLWLPTEDHTAPSQENLITGVAVITKSVQLNRKIYIHCKNGHGRAPTLLAAYYISTGLSLTDAIAKIKEARKEIHLNELQVKALEGFKKIILN